LYPYLDFLVAALWCLILFLVYFFIFYFFNQTMGTGGRSSVAGLKVALFGATGFLGRYVTNEFGQIGSVGYIANRGCEMETRHLKPMFDLGNVSVKPALCIVHCIP
jgi:hypothetical protein